MSNRTKIAIAAALVALSATPTFASNENDGGNETGGFVNPPSTVGVNPAFHPGWFPGYPRSSNAYGYAPEAYGYAPEGGAAYGYVPEGTTVYDYVPAKKHHVVHTPAHATH